MLASVGFNEGLLAFSKRSSCFEISSSFCLCLIFILDIISTFVIVPSLVSLYEFVTGTLFDLVPGMVLFKSLVFMSLRNVMISFPSFRKTRIESSGTEPLVLLGAVGLAISCFS